MRILLVDDESELIETLAERLELRGYDVDAVTSGAEALERVRAEVYDIAVVDLKMPGISGDAVAEQMAHELPRLPVIMLTGHGSLDREEDIGSKMPLVCAYLYKPVTIQKLLETIERCSNANNE